MGKLNRRMFAGAMAGAAIWIAGGCDGGGSAPSVDSSKTKATVTGTVKVNGAPATAGEIVFDPTNASRKDVSPVRAPIGADGKYTIETLTGQNTVTLGGAVATKNPVVQHQTKTFDVKSGSNTFDPEFGSASGSAPDSTSK